MTSAKRGLCVVISNEHFTPKSQLHRRTASEYDVQKLCDVFGQLGFELMVHVNVTASDMLKILVKGLHFVRIISE